MTHSLGERPPATANALYFGVRNLNYPRNRRFRGSLVRRGWRVPTVAFHDHGGFVRSSISLLHRGLRVGRGLDGGVDVVILSEFSLQYAWVAWIAARRFGSIFVVDRFVGLVESSVEDWQRFSRRSWRGRLHLLFDWLGIHLADVVITDTLVRAELLRAASPSAEVLFLPVGAPEWARPEDSVPNDAHRTIRVLYYGNYIPLHGLEFVMAAVDELSAVRPVSLTLVGDGESRATIERAWGHDDRVSFVDKIPEEQLRGFILESDVVLGAFGVSTKAATVIPNKVWQALACGRIVLTRGSEALQEIAQLVGDGQLITVPAGNSEAISNALATVDLTLLASPSYRSTYEKLEQYTNSRYSKVIDSLEDSL